MIEMYCRKCNKLFVPAPLHRYRDDHGFYCSWTCYNHRNQNNRLRGKKPQKVVMCDRNGNEIQTFQSALKAAERTGYEYQSIQNACKNSTPYRGYLWRYENDLP